MTRKRIVTIISIIAVAILLIKGRSLLKERQAEVASQQTPSGKVLHVRTLRPHTGTLAQTLSVPAQLLAEKSIALSTKLAGYIVRVAVKESQHVVQGDLLVQIDDTDVKATLASLKSTLAAQEADAAVAKRIYERNQKLYKVGGIAKEQLSISRTGWKMKRAQLEATRAKIAQTRNQLAYLKITAPFEGRIDAVLLHEGDMAAAGRPIVKMSDVNRKLRFSFAPKDTTLIAAGQEVRYKGRKIGTVRARYPAATNGLATAEVTVEEPLTLPVGATMNIDVVLKEAQGCLLPANTLLHRKDGVYVMAYVKGAFTPQKVTPLIENATQTLLEMCPQSAVAVGSEVKLAQLPTYGNVRVDGVNDASK